MSNRFVWPSLIAAIALLAFKNVAYAEPNENDVVLRKLAALEDRIATLEVKNKDYQREIDHARAQTREANDKLAKLSSVAPPLTKPVSLTAYASYPVEQTARNWTGSYWGASAGGAVTRSAVTSAEHIANFSGSAFPFNISGIDQLGTSGPAHGAGGLIDLFAGWNTQINRVVIGGQLEATYADLNFSSTGSKAYTYFDASGPNGMTATGDFRPQVTSRWMASALLRAGLLVNEDTLIYGIGGWSFATFEARNVTDNPFYQPVESFWADGWIAGAGLEHKLNDSWSIRAEYRYTSFGAAHTRDNFVFSTAGSFAETQTYQRQTQYQQSMQSGRIGVAYAFGPLR